MCGKCLLHNCSQCVFTDKKTQDRQDRIKCYRENFKLQVMWRDQEKKIRRYWKRYQRLQKMSKKGVSSPAAETKEMLSGCEVTYTV